MFRIYLPSSPDLPIVVYGFTYPCHWIYLPSSPDLPTFISGFTYHRHRIYLPLSPDLPTIVGPLYWKSFQKSQNLTVLCLSFFHQLMFNLLCLIRIVQKRKINLGPVYWKSPQNCWIVQKGSWDH